jgi:beta-galactosidase
VTYDEFSNLTHALPVRAAPDSPLPLPGTATATHWADGLTVTDADVLATYEHPHFGRFPAITTRRHGEGRITCVGTVPGRDLARALAAWMAPARRSAWRDLPASVTATTGTAPDGRRVHIVHNWSWQPASVHAPVSLADALNGTPLPAGTAVDLGPWDVRVLVSPKE